MTLLGKIFTVLILVMSLVFMSFTVAVYSTHRNWREEVTIAKADLQKLQTTNQQIRTQLESLQAEVATERAGRVFSVAALETHLLAEKSERERLEVANSRLEEGQRTAMTSFQLAQNNLTTANAEVNSLRNEVRVTHEDRDTQFSKVVILQDQLGQAEGFKARLIATGAQLSAQIGQMKRVLDRHGLNQNTPVDNIPPEVDGVVLAVGKGLLLEISIGSDEGLRQGHELEVYRNSNYLGRVIVRDVDPDRSVVEILRDFRQGAIRKGDKVGARTKIYQSVRR